MAVENLAGWFYESTTNAAGEKLPIAIPAGNNRIMVVALLGEETAHLPEVGLTKCEIGTTTVRPLTRIGPASGVTFLVGRYSVVEVWYLLEDDLASAVGDLGNLQYEIGNNTWGNRMIVAAGFLSGVDQINPIHDTGIDSDTGTQNPIQATLEVPEDGLALAFSSSNDNQAYANWQSPFVELIDTFDAQRFSGNSVASFTNTGVTQNALASCTWFKTRRPIISAVAFNSAETAASFVTVENLALTEYPAEVSAVIGTAATVELLAVTEYAQTVDAGADIPQNPDSWAWSDQGHTVSVQGEVQATSEALALTEYPALVGVPLTYLPNPDLWALAEYPAAIDHAVIVAVTSEALAVTEYAQSVAENVALVAGFDALELQEFAATIDGSVAINALVTEGQWAWQDNVQGAVHVVSKDWWRLYRKSATQGFNLDNDDGGMSDLGNRYFRRKRTRK